MNPENFAQDMTGAGDAVMSPGLFGGISISRTPTESQNFTDSIDAMALGHLRWPGGTLSETGVVRSNGTIHLTYNDSLPHAYDLGYPELIHPRALQAADGTPTGQTGFTDMLQTAIAQDASLSIILPTERYIDAPEEAAADVADFLDALFVEGRWNGGVLPKKLILDIGNENYDPEEYGPVSMEILRAVRDFRNDHPDVDFGIGLQAMQDGGSTADLIDILHDHQSDGDEGILSEVDYVRVHDLRHGMRALKNIEHGKKADAIHELIEAINDDRDLMGLEGQEPVGIYFSAWTASANDLGSEISLAMPSAGAMLSLFTGMAELGVDYAAAWGVGLQDTTTPVVMSWRDPASETLHLSPQGEVFRQMAETLPGMKLVAHEGLDDGREVPVNLFAFSDPSRVVIFLSANDLPAEGESVSVDLEDFGPIASAWAERVSVDGGLSGAPRVSTPEVTVDGSELTVRMTSDYEVVRIIAMREVAADDTRVLTGTDADDVLLGDVGDDLIEGGEGDDRLIGGRGNDRLQGGPGADHLRDGAGDDSLFGGAGDDTLEGGGGNDLLLSGDGNNLLYGGLGDDWLGTGPGENLVSGGHGSDLFAIDPAGQTVITDFDPSRGDRLDFHNLYDGPQDLAAALSVVDFSGTGEQRDLLVSHAGMGSTVLLGAAPMLDGVLASLTGVDRMAVSGPLPGIVLPTGEPAPVPPAPLETVGGSSAGTLPAGQWAVLSEHEEDLLLPVSNRSSDAEDEEPDEEMDDAEEAAGPQGTCFVATAAFGDRMNPDVVWLRRFRDTRLVRTAAGRAFIRFYWKVGPVMARHVRADRLSGRVFRCLIRGIITGLRAIP
jgi:Ca2+-binding RTX toxin-like protein